VTIAYKNKGSSNESPNGYRPAPNILIILFFKDLSYPSNGMYIKDPIIIYFGFESCKNAL